MMTYPEELTRVDLATSQWISSSINRAAGSSRTSRSFSNMESIDQCTIYRELYVRHNPIVSTWPYRNAVCTPASRAVHISD